MVAANPKAKTTPAPGTSKPPGAMGFLISIVVIASFFGIGAGVGFLLHPGPRATVHEEEPVGHGVFSVDDWMKESRWADSAERLAFQIQRGVTHPEAKLYRLGLCSEALEKWDETLRSYRKTMAATTDPMYQRAAMIGQGRALLARGKRAEARKFLYPLLFVEADEGWNPTLRADLPYLWALSGSYAHVMELPRAEFNLAQVALSITTMLPDLDHLSFFPAHEPSHVDEGHAGEKEDHGGGPAKKGHDDKADHGKDANPKKDGPHGDKKNETKHDGHEEQAVDSRSADAEQSTSTRKPTPPNKLDTKALLGPLEHLLIRYPVDSRPHEATKEKQVDAKHPTPNAQPKPMPNHGSADTDHGPKTEKVASPVDLPPAKKAEKSPKEPDHGHGLSVPPSTKPANPKDSKTPTKVDHGHDEQPAKKVTPGSDHHDEHSPPKTHAAEKHSKDAHGKDAHGKDAHGKDAHGKDAHGKDAHGKDAHGKDAHGKDAHGKDAHGKDAHGKDAHGKDAHGKDAGHAIDHNRGAIHGRKKIVAKLEVAKDKKSLLKYSTPSKSVYEIAEEVARSVGITLEWTRTAKQFALERELACVIENWTITDFFDRLTDATDLMCLQREEGMTISLPDERAPEEAKAFRVRVESQGLLRCLSFPPDHRLMPWILTELARLDVALGRTESALQWYSKVTEEWNAQNVLTVASFNSASLLAQQGNFAEARRFWRRAIDQGPGNVLEPWAYVQIGRTFLEEGDFATARRNFKRATAIADKSAATGSIALFEAVSYVLDKQPQQAQEVLRKGRLKITQDGLRGWGLFVDAYAAYLLHPTDRSRKQIADLLAAMAELTDNPLGNLGYFLRVQVLRDLGMSFEVIDYCRKVLPRASGPIKDPLEYRFGEALFVSGKAEEARTIFESLETRATSIWTAQASYYVAKLDFDLGDLRACEQRCRRIWQMGLLRDQRPLWRLWGDAWLGLGDAERAVQCYGGLEPEPRRSE